MGFALGGALAALRPARFDPQHLVLAKDILFDNVEVSRNFTRLWWKSNSREIIALVWCRRFMRPDKMAKDYPL
ncbi:MAG: hypothetical protein JXB15_02925, partial [Anaerolineales bacterium]|nr:hypothetical protein [Anaerolineales bacterium]